MGKGGGQWEVNGGHAESLIPVWYTLITLIICNYLQFSMNKLNDIEKRTFFILFSDLQ